MNAIKRAYIMLKRSKKETLSLLFSLTLSIGMLFVFINLQMGAIPNLEDQGTYLGTMGFNSVILQLFTISIIFVCTVNSFISNTYFLKAKSLEMCVYLSNGMNIYGLAKYLFMQSFLLLFVSTILGGVFGLILHPLLNLMIIYFVGVEIPVFNITLMGIALWLGIALYQCFFMIMFNIGHAYKAELRDLLDERQVMKIGDVRMVKIPVIIYFIIYGIGLFVLLVMPVNPMAFLGCSMAGLFGIQGLIRYGLPSKIEQIKRSHKRLDFEIMIVIGNAFGSLKVIRMYCLISFGALFFMCSFLNNDFSIDYIRFIYGLGYVLVLIMMFISIYFKIIIEARTRKEEYVHLELLGFNRKDLSTCIEKEMKIIFGGLLVLPMPFVIVTLLRYVISGIIELWIIAFIVITYIVVLIVTYMITTKAYKNIELGTIEGGILYAESN